jgi:hypothetical protein
MEFMENNGNEERSNLSELLRLIVHQYQDSVDRKERLENKALGHLTPLSIIVAASVAILIMIVQRNIERPILLLFFSTFTLQLIFSVLTFIYALKAYSIKIFSYPDLNDYGTRWKVPEADFLGGLIQTYQRAIYELARVIKKLVKNVKRSKICLTFSLVFGILHIVFFIIVFT